METNPQKQLSLDDLPDFFSIADLSRVLRISRATAYRMAEQGQLPCMKIGKRIILSRTHLTQWINQQMEVT